MGIKFFNNSPFDIVKQIALGMFISGMLYMVLFVAVSVVAMFQNKF